jgi:HD-like signal output (HDOD) protein
MARINDGLHAAWQAPHHDAAQDEQPAFQKAFDFVQSLASELSKGRVDLPAYPEVAMRVRQVLADEDVTNDRLARVILADAGLAARVLALANSAALSRGGRPCTDLRLAVTRVGHANVRSAALAYALAQIRAADSLAHIQQDLAMLWRRSTLVAATARVLAQRTRAAGADEAMLAGLLHNVGCVYILARADRHADFLQSHAARDAIMRDWHASIGKAIAQNWSLPEAVVEAIGEQDTSDRLEATRRDLQDVLYVAVRVVDFPDDPEALHLALQSVPAFQRLALSEAELLEAMRESATEMADLRAALGEQRARLFRKRRRSRAVPARVARRTPG